MIHPVLPVRNLSCFTLASHSTILNISPSPVHFTWLKKLNLSLIKVLELTSGLQEIEEERDKLNNTAKNQIDKSRILEILQDN